MRAVHSVVGSPVRLCGTILDSMSSTMLHNKASIASLSLALIPLAAARYHCRSHRSSACSQPSSSPFRRTRPSRYSLSAHVWFSSLSSPTQTPGTLSLLSSQWKARRDKEHGMSLSPNEEYYTLSHKVRARSLPPTYHISLNPLPFASHARSGVLSESAHAVIALSIRDHAIASIGTRFFAVQPCKRSFWISLFALSLWIIVQRVVNLMEWLLQSAEQAKRNDNFGASPDKNHTKHQQPSKKTS